MWGNQLRLSVDGNYVNLEMEDIFDLDNDGNRGEKTTRTTINLNNSAWDGQRLYLKLGSYINSDGGGRSGHRDVRFF